MPNPPSLSLSPVYSVVYYLCVYTTRMDCSEKVSNLKKAHHRYVLLLKDEINRERDGRLEWKNKYNEMREVARATSESAAIISHLEREIRIRDEALAKALKFEKGPVEFLEDLRLQAIENGSLK